MLAFLDPSGKPVLNCVKRLASSAAALLNEVHV